MKAVLAIFVVSLLRWTGAEMFTSLAQMKGVIEDQRFLVKSLRNYAFEERSRLRKIKAMIDSLERDSSITDDELIKFISNPMSVYRTVKSFNNEGSFGAQYTTILSLLDNMQHVESRLYEMAPVLLEMPTDEDYVGSIKALLRLQDTYQLSPTAFVDAGLNPAARHNNTRHAMSAFDCFEIGRIAYEEGYFRRAIDWFSKAMEVFKKESLPTVERTEILDYMGFCNFKAGNLDLAVEQTREVAKLVPNHPHAASNVVYFEKAFRAKRRQLRGDMGGPDGTSVDEMATPDPVDTEVNDIYKKLCRGEQTQPIKDGHKLFCDYARNNDPRLLIAPLKRETVSFEPWIMLYHDVISDREIEFFKGLALPKLNRATAVDYTSGQQTVADYRITKTAWFGNDTDTYFTRRLLNRISAMTQLTLEYVERFQVANYGIGGHYSSHYDHGDDGDHHFGKEEGNRMATLLFYISEVEAGGGTVFNELGVRVNAKKGAAAFWYNLDKNGLGDKRTFHGACPVLYGTKWVMNKWFHFGGNEFWHPAAKEWDPITWEDIEHGVPTYHRARGRMQL